MGPWGVLYGRGVVPSLKLTWHLKITPGKGDSYSKPSFLGAMLVLGRVTFLDIDDP